MRNSRLTLGLAFLATGFMLGCQDTPVNPAAPDTADPTFAKGGNPGPPGGDDGGGSQCKLKFNLEFDDSNPAVTIRSDGLGVYHNGVDEVQIFGGETGWRFDTNKGPARPNDKRKVTLDFTGTGPLYEDLADPDGLKAIDMRFDQDEGGLNFCALPDDGSVTGDVAAHLSFPSSPDGITRTLRWGGLTHSDIDCGALGADELTVTRIAQDEWQLASGANACLITSGGVIDAVIPMSVAFTVTAQ